MRLLWSRPLLAALCVALTLFFPGHEGRSGLFSGVAFALGGAPQAYPVAVRTYGVWDSVSHERFDFAVWYPGGSPDAGHYREGRFVPGTPNARVLPGFYPVLLVSHDAASGRFANADTAAALAGSGFVVIVPTHRGDNHNDSDLLFTAESLAQRPRQLLRALDTLLGTPEFALYLDESRIGVIGVGLGSLTALQLAGAAPDLSRLPRYCERFSNDPFCSDWALGRFLRPPSGSLWAGVCAAEGPAEPARKGGAAGGVFAGNGTNGNTGRAAQGRNPEAEKAFFCPPLDLYAPALEPAPVPARVSHEPESKRGDKKERKPSLWQRLFGGKDKEKEEDAGSALFEAGAADGPEGAEAPQARAGNSTSGPAAGREPMALDFQGGPLFGGTDSGAPFVHIATPDSPEFRMTVAEEPTAPLSPVPQPVKVSSLPAYRRPAENRRIKGAALLMPAGGMLFSRASLAAVRMPVAVVEAENDGLYNPRLHAQPYFAELPVRPEVLQIKGADHYSLFARCSAEMRTGLGELCGGMGDDAREAAHEQLDSFLVSFFQSVLGGPRPPAEPSGFVGAPPPDPAPAAVKNATLPVGDAPALNRAPGEDRGRTARTPARDR